MNIEACRYRGRIRGGVRVITSETEKDLTLRFLFTRRKWKLMQRITFNLRLTGKGTHPTMGIVAMICRDLGEGGRAA